MPLFEVQDSDAPKYVLARTFNEAIENWERVIRANDHDDDPSEPIEPPLGVRFVCADDDLVVSSAWAGCRIVDPSGERKTFDDSKV